ncbi:hypothetical protein KUL118_64410 [Tenacibaculum sp. KUL118]|nr:hypothetical protein KUL118_64410 [Tenacibaculum sp. KUL118]
MIIEIFSLSVELLVFLIDEQLVNVKVNDNNIINFFLVPIVLNYLQLVYISIKYIVIQPKGKYKSTLLFFYIIAKLTCLGKKSIAILFFFLLALAKIKQNKKPYKNVRLK